MEPRGPLVPEGEGPVQGEGHVGRGRRRGVRGVPAEDEGDALSGDDGEGEGGPVGGDVGVARARAAVQPGRVRPGDRGEGAPVHGAGPRRHAAVVEADPQLAPHVDPSGDPVDDPDDPRGALARRHEVGDPDGAGDGFPDRLQDEGVATVTPAAARKTAGRGEPPAAVPRVPEEGGEAGGRVEPRGAPPVDRSVPADESGGLKVADEGVVLDAPSHVGNSNPGAGEPQERADRQRRGNTSVHGPGLHTFTARRIRSASGDGHAHSLTRGPYAHDAEKQPRTAEMQKAEP